MKRILFLLMMLCAYGSFAQAPQGIPYQAVARNSSGAILAGTVISVRFTIRDSVSTGAIKYRETFSVTTSSQGMFSVNVGQGTPVTGTFAGINWGSNAKFMQVEMDPAGGGSYVDMGTQQMMSVPYSIYSNNGMPSGNSLGDILYWNSTTWVKLPAGTTGQVLTMGSGGTPVWAGCSLPTAGSITGIATVFTGSTTTLSNATTGGEWSSNATDIATVDSTGIVTGVAAGTAIISYTKTLACGSATTTLAVTVTTLTIGASYGGGKIAYIFMPGDPGYIAGETHGLIAAPNDQGVAQWGCYGTFVGGTTTGLGTGLANTGIISAACGESTAARLCADWELGGYSDWYLPSRGDLMKVYINRMHIGGFLGGFYWCSSDSAPGNAWYVNFIDGSAGGFSKYELLNVRAVRSF
jgi:hypothetical protein